MTELNEMEDHEVVDPEDQETMTNWPNEPTIDDLKTTIEDAESDQETHAIKVANWLKNRAADRPQVDGVSNVQPKLIRKQAEWRYSSLEDPFLSTPDIFNVYPTTAGDVKRARQNGQVLNKQFNTQINKVKFVGAYVRDAVDIGTVVVKLAWANETETIKDTIPQYQYQQDQSGQLAQQYMELAKLRIEDPEGYADHGTPGIDHALDMFMQTGIAQFVKEDGEIVTTKEVETKNQPMVEVSPSENIIVDPSCGGDLDKAIFVGEKYKSSMAELKRDGKYKNLDKLNTKALTSPLEEPDFEEGEDITAFSFKDTARKQFVVYTYWGEWDVEGDGTTQQIVATWVGDVCIRKELNPFPDRRPPFVIAVYMPVRDSIWGEPDGELLKENQDIIGAVTRGAIDLLAKSANSQTGMAKGFLDTTNLRRYKKGLDYEFNSNVDPGVGVYQHKFPELPRSIFDMLGMQNNEAESLTGVKDYDSGINSGSLGSVASNAGRSLDAAALRELGILRRLAEGMLQIGRKIIAMNAEFLSEKEVVRITDDKFVEIRRDDLAGKFDLRLSISTAEEDAGKASELAFMLQTAGPSMDLDFQKIVLGDIARLRKMPDLAEKIENYQPEPDPMAQEMHAQEMKLKDAQIEKEYALAYKHRAEGDAAGGRGEKDLAQGRLNDSKVGEEQGKARKHHSESDTLDQDYLRKADGTDHAEEIQKQNQKDSNKLVADLALARENTQNAK
jgi:hypothetical protein